MNANDRGGPAADLSPPYSRLLVSIRGFKWASGPVPGLTHFRICGKSACFYFVVENGHEEAIYFCTVMPLRHLRSFYFVGMHTEPTGRATVAGLMVVVVLLFPLTGFLFNFAHSLLLHYRYIPHARRWCQKSGFKVDRWRTYYAFDKSGIKTEFTAVELDCVDGNGQRRFVFLLVWLFGVKTVLGASEFPIEEMNARNVVYWRGGIWRNRILPCVS